MSRLTINVRRRCCGALRNVLFFGMTISGMVSLSAEAQEVVTGVGMPQTIEFATQATSLSPASAGAFLDRAPINDRPPGTRARAEDLSFTIRIWEDEIELAGAIPTQQAGAALLKQLRLLQPGSDIWDNQLEVDREAPQLPSMSDLSGLLTEMVASTRNGKLHFTFDSVTVSGVSDTPVIRSAVQVRLDEMAEKLGVATRNSIRIIPKDDFLKPSERLKQANEGVRHFSRIPNPPASGSAMASEGPPNPNAKPGELFLAEEIEALSPKAHAIIKRLQTLPDSPAVLQPAYEDIRARLGAEPVLQVHFRSNSATIKQENAARILEVIEGGPPGAEFLVVGYASMEGNPKINAQLSLQRAAAVGGVIAESEKVAATEAFYFGPTRRFDLRRSTANRVVEIWRLRGQKPELTATAQR